MNLISVNDPGVLPEPDPSCGPKVSDHSWTLEIDARSLYVNCSTCGRHFERPAMGPYDMDQSPDCRRIGGGSVLVESQEPWGFPHLSPNVAPCE